MYCLIGLWLLQIDKRPTASNFLPARAFSIYFILQLLSASISRLKLYSLYTLRGGHFDLRSGQRYIKCIIFLERGQLAITVLRDYSWHCAQERSFMEEGVPDMVPRIQLRLAACKALCALSPAPELSFLSVIANIALYLLVKFCIQYIRIIIFSCYLLDQD